ncbi:histidine--tRNA ligase, partial [Candidatus Woesearchaeota archaeon CG_4_10_14_0_8_um_filter_47_5]
EAIPIVQKFRSAGINTDFDIMGRGLTKNIQYADAYGIPYVLFIGKNELEQGKVKLRDMKTGKEELLSIEQAVKRLA